MENNGSGQKNGSLSSPCTRSGELIRRVRVDQDSRGENTLADALAALALISDSSLRRVILVEFIEKSSIKLTKRSMFSMSRTPQIAKMPRMKAQSWAVIKNG